MTAAVSGGIGYNKKNEIDIQASLIEDAEEFMKRLDEFKRRKGAEENPEDSLNGDPGFGGGGGGSGGGAGGGDTTTSNSVRGGGGGVVGGLASAATKAASKVSDGRERKVRAT